MNKAAQVYRQLEQQNNSGPSVSSLAGLGALALSVGVLAGKGKKGIATMGKNVGMKIKNMAVAKNTTTKATEVAAKVTGDVKKVNKKVTKTYTDTTGKIDAIRKAQKETAQKIYNRAKKNTPKVKARKKRTTTGKIDKNVENYDIA